MSLQCTIVKQVGSTAPIFLNETEQKFINEHGFEMSEHYDDRVVRYFGHWITDKAKELLSRRFPDQPKMWVFINFNDNSDIDCPRTYCVEIAFCDDVHDAQNTTIYASGTFGCSSKACPSLETAFEEAAIRLLILLFVTPPPSFHCFRRRY